MKKDLIAVFAYTPNDQKKKILEDLLFNLNQKRNNYDILVVSHSSISDLSYNLLDHFYLDPENKLIKDFDLTNKFWFSSSPLKVNSSMVYPFSTHLAIYRLLYFAFTFAKFKGYNKIHCIEYDIKMEDLNLIDRVNTILDEKDVVMFKDPRNNWTWGVYFASNISQVDISNYLYDEEKILNDLRSTETRMTENVTPNFLTNGVRTIEYLSIFDIDQTGNCQAIDRHEIYEMKWCVPVYEEKTNLLHFFIHNEWGVKKTIEVIADDIYLNFKVEQKGVWSIHQIGDFDSINEIRIFVDKEEINHIILDSNNRDKFKKNNFCTFL